MSGCQQAVAAPRRLKLALVRGCHEVGFDDITVVYLTNKAGVSRSTFYRHYVDKYDLITSLVSRNLGLPGPTCPAGRDGSTESASTAPASRFPGVSDLELRLPKIQALFAQLDRHQSFYRALLLQRPSSWFRSWLAERLRAAVMIWFPELGEDRTCLSSYAAAHALIGVMEAWLDHGIPTQGPPDAVSLCAWIATLETTGAPSAAEPQPSCTAGNRVRTGPLAAHGRPGS